MKIDEDNRVKHQRLENENILIGKSGVRAVVDCELLNCTLTLDVKHFALFRCVLKNCTLIVKNQLKESQAFNCRYERCAFKGKFLAVDFGRDPVIDPVSKTYDTLGKLIDCDFTEATLDLCRFFSVDISRQKFASWPQFVVPFAQRVAASKLERQWPGEFKLFLDLAAHQLPNLSATTGTVNYYCHNQKKNRGFSLTEAELRQALLDVGGVVM
jgi:hypothetical protein